MRKSVTIFARISEQLKHRLEAEAASRGEAEAVVIREALRLYFESGAALGKASVVPVVYPAPLATKGIALNELPARKLKPLKP